MSVLASYILTPTPARKEEIRPHLDCKSRHPRPPSDVQAALTVLGRRPPGINERPVDLEGIDVPHGDFRNARLNGAVLEFATLPHADFVRASLKEAQMRGANMEGAVFVWADVTGADFSGANLRYAIFAGGYADMPFIDLADYSDLSDFVNRVDLDNLKKKRTEITAIGLKVEQILEAEFDHTTKLPEDIAAHPEIKKRLEAKRRLRSGYKLRR
ncbi:pentapeptide repeat-containing protein [Streptomyces sp. NPDC057746]|uniref:pentapeptide repeat-containing protein n=1 Tax=Streptomyces sp. NPDC057746 TaxID=3346237 RepID=UPI0036A068AD